MRFLNIVCYVAFLTSIVTLPFLLVNFWQYVKSRPVNSLATDRGGFPIKSVGFFLISIAVAMVASTMITTHVRRDTLEFLNNLSGQYSVYVNEQEVHDSEKIISALKQVSPYGAHHSHPTKRIRVLIRNNFRDLTLELGRDSENPQEYWVFSSEHDVASSNEMGRITTFEFDKY